MKSINKYIIVFILGLISFSCQDYLTKSPLNQPSDDNFLKNETELEMAVNGAYNTLWFQPPGTGQPFSFTFEAASDNGWDRNGSQLQVLGKGDATPDNGYTGSFWQTFYEGIGRCNYILSKAEPLKEEMSEGKYNRLLSEVRFLRAFYYSYLSELFGGVPLVTEPVELSEAEIPRSTKAEVVDFILSELEAIGQHLSYEIGNKARVTKGSVQALRSRVALYNERWAESAQAAQILIDQGIYNLHDDFEELFKYAGENSQEIIMSVPYLKGENVHSLPRIFYSRMALGHSNKVPSQSLVDSYESIDGLSIDESPLYDPENPFENRDPRLDYTVVLPNTRFIGYIFNTNPDSTEVWNYNTSPPERVENTEATHAYSSFTGYLWRKYADPADKEERDNSELDIILFRYAEVLLNYAEAKIELGEIDQSVYNAINTVRTRPSVDMPAIAGGKSQSELRNIIRRERRYEFAGEGLRYFDIRRWNIAHEILPGTLRGRIETGYLSEAPEIDEVGTPSYNNVSNADEMEMIESRSFNENRDYLWPIPRIELETNSELEQNPNY